MKVYIERSMTFDEYIHLIDKLIEENKTTGTDQSEAKVGFTRLNRQRMSRLAKTVVLDAAIREKISAADREQIWLIISEGWCGDAAQNVPVIEKVAAENPRIQTRYILRDENVELMDKFLTNGARSIPKLVAVDAISNEVLWTWGARPKVAQAMFERLKADGIEKSDILELLQRWYNEDKGRALSSELAEMIAKHDLRSEAIAAI